MTVGFLIFLQRREKHMKKVRERRREPKRKPVFKLRKRIDLPTSRLFSRLKLKMKLALELRKRQRQRCSRKERCKSTRHIRK